MSTPTPPDACPYCGSGLWRPSDFVLVYDCGFQDFQNPTAGKQRSKECYKRELAAVKAERDNLRAWKDSAMQIETEWDVQELAKLCGGELGRSCREAISRFIKEEVPNLRAHVARLRGALEDIAAGVERPGALSDLEMAAAAKSALFGDGKEGA